MKKKKEKEVTEVDFILLNPREGCVQRREGQNRKFLGFCSLQKEKEKEKKSFMALSFAVCSPNLPSHLDELDEDHHPTQLPEGNLNLLGKGVGKKNIDQQLAGLVHEIRGEGPKRYIQRDLFVDRGRGGRP